MQNPHRSVSVALAACGSEFDLNDSDRGFMLYVLGTADSSLFPKNTSIQQDIATTLEALWCDSLVLNVGKVLHAHCSGRRLQALLGP